MSSNNYELEIEKINQENKRYLEVIEAELNAANLKSKTISKPF